MRFDHVVFSLPASFLFFFSIPPHFLPRAFFAHNLFRHPARRRVGRIINCPALPFIRLHFSPSPLDGLSPQHSSFVFSSNGYSRIDRRVLLLMRQVFRAGTSPPPPPPLIYLFCLSPPGFLIRPGGGRLSAFPQLLQLYSLTSL